VFGSVQLIQIDSVNVLARSQELPLWARLGSHRRDVLARMANASELFEYWGHEASLIPASDWPLFQWRMAEAAAGKMWPGLANFEREQPHYLREVLAAVTDRGASSASELREGPARKGTWWSWDAAKYALEWLFWTGALTARRRPGNFERVYDLPERMLPAEVLRAPVPAPDDARVELLERAAAALGVATDNDLLDYYRMRGPVARAAINRLAETGAIQPIRVEGWRERAWLHRDAARPRSVGAATVLSPFDSLVWDRKRTERLFGFRYRIEIYTPAPQRVYGYYVLPFLLGERIVGRVDLKADRQAGVLRVQGAFTEPACEPGEAAAPLATELRAMCAWLGLDDVVVGRRGNLARALGRAVRSA
jgi:uncharacterized protein YcaQ